MPLRLSRRKNSPNWYIRGTVRGTVVDESTGTDSRDAAEALRIQREAELLHRSVHGARATATFLEAAVAYMETGGETRYLGPLLDHFRETRLAAIDQRAIDRAAAALYPDAMPSTRNRQVYTPVSAVLRFAADRDLAAPRRIHRPRQGRERIRWLTVDEAERLIAACAPHMARLVTFMLYTGARAGEALYLDWRAVDLARAHVTFAETKNGAARGVPLHPRLIALLANLPHRRGAVFRKADGKPYARRTSRGGGQMKTGFAAACRRAGLEDLRPHDLRHTWATWHYAANRDLNALMRLGGWKSEKMVLRYAHINVGELSRSIDALPWQAGKKPGSGTMSEPRTETAPKA